VWGAMRGDAWGCVGMCGELLGGASATFAASARPAAHAKDDVSVPRQHSQDLHAKLGVKYGRTPAWLFRLQLYANYQRTLAPEQETERSSQSPLQKIKS
jgi:hypothetical protein